MKFLRMFGVIFVILVALICVGLIHEANALSVIDGSSLSENFIKNIRDKLKPPALEVLSLSEFNNQNDADRALKSLETALASFRKEFGSQLSVANKAMPVVLPTQGPVSSDQGSLEDEDNKFDAPAAALGGSNLPSIGGVGAPEPIQPPAAILSSVPAALPGSPLPPLTTGTGAVSSGLPMIPPPGNLPAITPVGNLPQFGDQGQEDEGVDFGGDVLGEFDLGGDFGIPSLDQQENIQPLGGFQAPMPLPSVGGPLPVVAPLPGSNPVPVMTPAINPLPVQNPAALPSIGGSLPPAVPLPAITPAPAVIPAIKPLSTPSPAPKPLAAPVIAPLSPVAQAEHIFDIPVVRKAKKIKSLDRKMDKMMVLGSVFQEAAAKQTLALASHQEQSKNFDLMSLSINNLPKVVTNNAFVGLEQASVALAGLGDLE